MPEDLPPTLHIAEGGFRPRLELLEAYGKRHEQFMPHARAQGGFRETYGGPIAGTPWWLFFAKFDTLEAMEEWQHDREHVKVQDEAREKWWTAYYLRKGRILADNEAATGTILNETMLLRDTALSDEEHSQVTVALSDILRFGVIPYEALKGRAHPYTLCFCPARRHCSTARSCALRPDKLLEQQRGLPALAAGSRI